MAADVAKAHSTKTHDLRMLVSMYESAFILKTKKEHWKRS
jgi:hypothetical protein